VKKRNSQATGSPAGGDNTRYIAEVTFEDAATGKKSFTFTGVLVSP